MCFYWSGELTAHGQVFESIGVEVKQLLCLDHSWDLTLRVFSKCLCHTFPPNSKCISKEDIITTGEQNSSL